MGDQSKSHTDSGYATPSSLNSSSSTAISALNRLRYNLSPVTSYYKPIMKTFGRRDESPAKV